MNNFMKDCKSPSGARSPINIRKMVSPMRIKKTALNMGGLTIEHSDDDEPGSQAKLKQGENPFDSGVNEQQVDNLRNLFFHRGEPPKVVGKTGDTAEFGK